jgi:hypothetical protein
MEFHKERLRQLKNRVDGKTTTNIDVTSNGDSLNTPIWGQVDPVLDDKGDNSG